MSDPVALSPAFLRAASFEPTGTSGGGARPAGKEFGDILQSLVRETDELQKASDASLQGLGAGETDDVHQVMLAMAKADLSFRLLVEVRNKLTDAFQEVMRMPV